jgi:hypothetical protein
LPLQINGPNTYFVLGERSLAALIDQMQGAEEIEGQNNEANTYRKIKGRAYEKCKP